MSDIRRALGELARSHSEPAIAAVVELADEFRAPEVARLAEILANSGAMLTRDFEASDIASTGGPSSLSTLLCPLYLRSAGARVPKLGVPGRPAGGIDVLATVPGYCAQLPPDEARRALNDQGQFHLLAGDQWAPLDSRMFAQRQRTNAQVSRRSWRPASSQRRSRPG